MGAAARSISRSMAASIPTPPAPPSPPVPMCWSRERRALPAEPPLMRAISANCAAPQTRAPVARAARNPVRQELRALYFASAIYHLRLFGGSPRGVSLPLEPWPGERGRGDMLLAGEFRFENEYVRAPSPPWRADIAAVGSEAAWQTARDWTADWIKRFEIYDRLAWRADVIGNRLFAWLE